VASVIAMVVSVKRYGEQWWIWLAVNSVSIYMWWQNFAQGNDNMATLIMWVVYLINGVFILIKWERELKNERREKNGYGN
jgi:nicotinamide mononucleotide transporter